jgi:LysM repeat protein
VSGSSPARLLAPLALVVCAIALIVVLTSGGGDEEPASTGGPAATATATPTAAKRAKRTATPEAEGKTYTVKAGDSPSSIAAAEGISVDELLEANPDANPTALSVGDELKIPAG